ncbi:MAG: carboxylesterase [Pseudomonadota bacterium]|nr:carboxylesterase [Pseudomonadota bacterium]
MDLVFVDRPTPNGMEEIEFLENETGSDPVGCVIWMHGLGADATDFEPIVPLLPLEANLRFIFPNAPVRPIKANGGMEMRGWYDIDPGSPLANNDDIRSSVHAITGLIEHEVVNGFRYDQITIAGFSQGGVIALELGLGFRERLRGIMALSTYVNDHQRLAERVDFANVDTPIFMAHGVSDPMIPITRAITSRQALLDLSYSVQWQEYAMGHQVCPQQITHIGQWLNTIYSP